MGAYVMHMGVLRDPSFHAKRVFIISHSLITQTIVATKFHMKRNCMHVDNIRAKVQLKLILGLYCLPHNTSIVTLVFTFNFNQLSR